MAQARKGGQGGEGRGRRAQPLFLSPKVTPEGIQVQSQRPSPGHAGTLGTARHKADATGTAWVVGKQRFWQPEGLQGRMGEIPQRKSVKKKPQIKT